MGASASFLACQVGGEILPRPGRQPSPPKQVEKKLTRRIKHVEERVCPCPQTELDCSAVRLGVKRGSVCTCQDYLHGRG